MTVFFAPVLLLAPSVTVAHFPQSLLSYFPYVLSASLISQQRQQNASIINAFSLSTARAQLVESLILLAFDIDNHFVRPIGSIFAVKIKRETATGKWVKPIGTFIDIYFISERHPKRNCVTVSRSIAFRQCGAFPDSQSQEEYVSCRTNKNGSKNEICLLRFQFEVNMQRRMFFLFLVLLYR